MNQGKIWREFIALPPEAQQQVADFIVDLQTRYQEIRAAKKFDQDSLTEDQFIGLWRDREDMQDSRAWVRRIREQEWLNPS